MKMKVLKRSLGTGLLLVIGLLFALHHIYAETTGTNTQMSPDMMLNPQQLAVATFAGGCFWCMEPPFEKLPGVKSVISGFSGGDETNPSYHQVASGKTGHREAVQIRFDPSIISYEKLLEVYWHQIDPTDAGGSFVDRGRQYSSAIFFHDPQQQQLAVASKAELDASGRYPKPIVTVIEPYTSFYAAEDDHQDYYLENRIRYTYYRYNSGRDRYLDEIWGETRMDPPKYAGYQKPSTEYLKKTLTPIQYEVTQLDATEPAFKNAYWNNNNPGIYVDIVSGEPLFSSRDKFKSGTGWPSFTQPVEGTQLVEKTDSNLFYTRIELRSAMADSHLGHVFDDGPGPRGLRYCINSAALRFIPAEDLEQAGYPQFASLFR